MNASETESRGENTARDAGRGDARDRSEQPDREGSTRATERSLRGGGDGVCRGGFKKGRAKRAGRRCACAASRALSRRTTGPATAACPHPKPPPQTPTHTPRVPYPSPPGDDDGPSTLARAIPTRNSRIPNHPVSTPPWNQRIYKTPPPPVKYDRLTRQYFLRISTTGH